MQINIYKDKLLDARLFGASVLYSAHPIPREDVPQGWFKPFMALRVTRILRAVIGELSVAKSTSLSSEPQKTVMASLFSAEATIRITSPTWTVSLA